MEKIERVEVIGVPISVVNMETSLQYIRDHMEEAKGDYICVSNVYTTVMAKENPVYLAVQTESFLSIPDGKPLSVLGKRMGFTEMGRVTGPDLMRAIFRISEEKGYTHYFYGNNEDNLKTLVEKLKDDYPHLTIVGYEPSVFHELSETEEAELVGHINMAHPDFIWIGIGAPRQEFLCSRLKWRVCGLMVGVGGAFNVLAGIVPEAPKWMQNMSLEWLYRLMQEPKRLFKRYFTTNFKFLWLVTKGLLQSH